MKIKLQIIYSHARVKIFNPKLSSNNFQACNVLETYSDYETSQWQDTTVCQWLVDTL
jgi:hypothetical protein